MVYQTGSNGRHLSFSTINLVYFMRNLILFYHPVFRMYYFLYVSYLVFSLHLILEFTFGHHHDLLSHDNHLFRRNPHNHQKLWTYLYWCNMSSRREVATKLITLKEITLRLLWCSLAKSEVASQWPRAGTVTKYIAKKHAGKNTFGAWVSAMLCLRGLIGLIN